MATYPMYDEHGSLDEFKTMGAQTDPGVSRNTYELTFQNPAKANNYAITESVGRLAVVSNDAEKFFVSDVVDYTYDGSEHKQAVTVRNHLLQELAEGKDYTLSYEVDENVGTLTVNAPDTKYYCESGADGAWTKGSSKTLGFVYKRTWDDEKTFDHFKGLSVDGKAVSAEGYEARRGSVVVDLLPSYLETLGVGDHTLTTEFDDGDAVTVAFTVREGSNAPSGNGDAGGSTGGSVGRAATPRTGDHATPAPFVALVLGVIGAVSCVLSRRYKTE